LRKRGICALVLVGLFALVVIGSSAPSSANSLSYVPLEPFKSFTPASSEWLDVDAFDATYDNWDTKTGTSPYLDAQDEPTNFIEDNTASATIGWFSFPDTTMTGTLTVNVSIYASNDDGAGNDDFTVYYDFTGGSGAVLFTPDLTTSYAYYTATVTGCDTVAEVNSLRFYFETNTVTQPDQVRADHMRIGVSGTGGGTAYEKDLLETVTVAETIENAAAYDRSYTESVSAADVITTAADMARNLVESIGVVGVLAMIRGREKDLVEAITVSDVRTLSASYARDLVETISVSDVWSKTFGLNRTESISVVDSGDFSKAIQKNMTETIGVVDSWSRSVGYNRNFTENITAVDVRTLSADFVRDLVEAITVVDTIEESKAIQKQMTETIGVVDSWSRAVGYNRNLTESIAAVDVRTLSADFVRNLVETITVVEIIDIQKLGGIDYEKDLTEAITVSIELETDPPIVELLIGSMFYQLFFSLDMWGYLGPLSLVIIGYIVASKDKSLGVIWFVLESLVIVNYLSLVAETPAYWWHTLILLIGGMSTLAYSLWGRWK